MQHDRERHRISALVENDSATGDGAPTLRDSFVDGYPPKKRSYGMAVLINKRISIRTSDI